MGRRQALRQSLRRLFAIAPGLLLAGLLAGVSSGCVSAMVLGSGKGYRHLINSDVRVSQVRRELGEPEWRQCYPRPTPIGETPEFQHFLHEFGIEPWLEGTAPPVRLLSAATCEVYSRTGPFADDGPMVGAAMGVGCTMLVGEVFDPLLLPVAVAERRKMGRQRYWLTFWYDAEGKFLALYGGDIRDVKPSPP